MAGHMNRATLVGNVGKDPEVRTTSGGQRIVNFSLATTESWRDKSSGDKKERTSWHNIVIFNEPVGKIAEQYLKKGSKVLIEGAIETRKYEQNGVDKYTTEIVLRPYGGNLLLLGDKDEGGRSSSYSDARSSSSRPSQSTADIIDDSIPF